jgi:hypothetical protein
MKPVLNHSPVFLHLSCRDRFAWGIVKARKGKGRVHLRYSRVRVYAARLVAILALHNATNFE